MIPSKPVSVLKHAFVFCRYSVAALIWIAFLTHMKWLMVFVLALLLASALLGVRRAPMILLYSTTVNKIVRSEHFEMLNENAMRFAHAMGSFLSLICILTLYFLNERTGWIIVFFFAILKTVSALGFCPASKLFDCATSGSCCSFLKKS